MDAEIFKLAYFLNAEFWIGYKSSHYEKDV